jgi:hypothetical protein
MDEKTPTYRKSIIDCVQPPKQISRDRAPLPRDVCAWRAVSQERAWSATSAVI